MKKQAFDAAMGELGRLQARIDALEAVAREVVREWQRGEDYYRPYFENVMLSLARLLPPVEDDDE
jgi:hypothetical protein